MLCTAIETPVTSWLATKTQQSGTTYEKKSKRIHPDRVLVVIAIIGILASMLLPTLAKAKKKANRMKCANNIKNGGGAALGAYAGDFEAYPWNYAGTNKDFQAQGYRNRFDAVRLGYIWGAGTLKDSLVHTKMLVSPADPKVISKAASRPTKISSSDFGVLAYLVLKAF